MSVFLSIVCLIVLYAAAFFAQHYILRHTTKKYKFVVPIAYLVILLVLFLTHLIKLSPFLIFFGLGAIQLFSLEQQLKCHDKNH